MNRREKDERKREGKIPEIRDYINNGDNKLTPELSSSSLGSL